MALAQHFFATGVTRSRRCRFQLLWRVASELVASDGRARRAAGVACLLCLATAILYAACHASNSMALAALAFLLLFDIAAVGVSLLSVWAARQKPDSAFTFGYARFEVVAVFAAAMLGILTGFATLKECVERLFEAEEEISSRHLALSTFLTLAVHLLAVYGVENPALGHVIDASSSSWLQEHVTDMSESLCQWVPGLSKLLLPRLHPVSLLGLASGLVVLLVNVSIDVNGYHAVDAIGAILIALMTFGTMMPMAVYCGRILLQTTPAHLLSQLDKALREASTLDGVLELRKEHFWSLGFGQLAGTLQVRVRRDANEQMVLAHVTNRICNLVPRITIQVFKDDWTRSIGTFSFNWPANQPPRVNPFLGDIQHNLPDLVPEGSQPATVPTWPVAT